MALIRLNAALPLANTQRQVFPRLGPHLPMYQNRNTEHNLEIPCQYQICSSLRLYGMPSFSVKAVKVDNSVSWLLGILDAKKMTVHKGFLYILKE